MKAYLINRHLLVPRSRSPAKVKVKYKGYISQKKNGRFGGIRVSQTHLVFLVSVVAVAVVVVAVDVVVYTSATTTTTTTTTTITSIHLLTLYSIDTHFNTPTKDGF